jgi:hypothetical protein
VKTWRRAEQDDGDPEDHHRDRKTEVELHEAHSVRRALPVVPIMVTASCAPR